MDFIVNAVFNSRTYILSDENNTSLWLVDCGDIDVLLKMLNSICDSLQIKGVLLTHTHYDHIYGLPKLTQLFPDVVIYTNSIGKEMLANEKMNMSRYHEDPINFENHNIIECGEGDSIDLFEGVQARVFYTPGHNPSCLTYEVGNCLFTGDAYIPGIKVVTTLPHADKQLAIQSVERIKSLSEGSIVYPGHELVIGSFI